MQKSLLLSIVNNDAVTKLCFFYKKQYKKITFSLEDIRLQLLTIIAASNSVTGSKKRRKNKLERKKHIRNLDRIRQMSVEELAPLLVHESYEFDVDYDWDIETYDTIYNSPSGGVFNNYDDALDDCVQWLNAEPE